MLGCLINAIRRWWLTWEADDLNVSLREINALYALNHSPADNKVARSYRMRLAELEVLIATLQPPLKRRPLPLTTT